MNVIITNHDGQTTGVALSYDGHEEIIMLATGKKVVFPFDGHKIHPTIQPRGPGWTLHVEKDGDEPLYLNGVELPEGGRMVIRRPEDDPVPFLLSLTKPQQE